MRVPPESRMVVKRFPSRHPLPLPVGEVASAARTEGQITATSIGKCWHLRRQMTSRGRKALSVTCGDSSPKGEPRHRILAQEMERICIDTLHSVLRLPLNARAARKSDGRKTVSVPGTPCLSLWGRWPAQRGRRRANNGNVNPGKCWHLRRQMTSRGRKALSVTCGDSSPKGRAKASYIGTRNGAYLYRYAPFTVYGYPSMRVPPESRMVVKRFPSRHPLPLLWERWPAQRGRRRANNGNVNRKMLAPSQADDVPRAQGPLSHLR